jgi:RHS repeat-associated protein
MLITPVGLQQTAQAATKYNQISTADWSSGNRTIEYTYDTNGSLVTKTTKETSTQTILETFSYEYNLQNRLKKADKEYDDSGDTINEVMEYAYNDDGIRVKSYYYETVNGGAKQNEETKLFLIDAYNHTGYAQVFVEDDGTDTTSYIIGDDVLAQATNTSNPQYLLYDGHGSTRQTTDNAGVVTDSFSYDAYGVTLGSPSSTTTNLLYAGEQFDNNLNQYYLRARYYNPLNGTFNRIDPFSGNNQDPQSLHKYLYCHNNPVNNIDPSGESDFSLVTTLVVFAIIAILFSANIANAPGPNDVVYPDASDEMIEDAFFVVAGCLLINYVILPAARTSIRYIGRGLRAPFKGFGKGPGKWVKVKENISPRAAQYQTKITGKPVEEVYIVDGVKFDGFKNGKLIDAKGPGYKNFVENDGAFNNSWWRGREQLMNQAVNQMQAAKGIPIEWHWAEKEAFIAGQELLGTNAKGIKMVFTPVK